MADKIFSYPALVVDAASPVNWVGIKRSATDLVDASSATNSSANLYELIEQALDLAGLTLSDVATVLYCEGPGSMLSIRSTVMTIRAWEGIGITGATHLFTYNSLQLGAALLANDSKISASEAILVTDARRNAWNALELPENSSLRIIENADLELDPRPKLTLSGFPRWTKTKATFQEIPYLPSRLFADERFLRIVRPVPFAAPLNLRESDFRKWTPKIHSAPVNPK